MNGIHSENQVELYVTMQAREKGGYLNFPTVYFA